MRWFPLREKEDFTQRRKEEDAKAQRQSEFLPFVLASSVLRLCGKYVHWFFCHCATTKHDVNFVCSLLISGSSFINGGEISFLLPAGMRKISEFKTSRKAMLPWYFAFLSVKLSAKSFCIRTISMAASLSEKKRSNRYQMRRITSGNEPVCGSMKHR